MARADTATSTTRAPRGTRVVSQAFFTALESIPEATRSAVARAAQTLIRAELKNRREKTKAVALKEKARRPTATKRAAKAATTEPASPAATTASGKRRSRKLADASAAA